MVKRNQRELMMITLQKATDFYLAALETEGKNPVLATRLICPNFNKPHEPKRSQ
jgi:hypothetical protein